MKTKIISIETYKAVIIPKSLLEKYNFNNVVDIEDTGSGVFIKTKKKPREGWEEAFKKLVGTKDDTLIETPDNEWVKKEWRD